ncbi:type IV toxin-antitoxin system AbiEi family antitoxin domain-containing protein [Actinomyces minihominis]|uniref:type IV toxin-antitoxin system AbiEi family antitoxin domain-containing protein n=1 Tax=Actinomyces minihominis TaxID=2002838 RepID=UPI000C0703A7|nr:type IV toxin-antitoxin system AbiEi family antitoxin domain-containing protein [Actinomyces minihominis]
MKAGDALRVLAEVTASQWGMVTAAQAAALGVDRLTLARLADSGHLERLAHGVYRDAGAPSDQFEDLRAVWLSTEPKLRAEERIRDAADGVVVASSSAAMLHGVGDLWANRHEFVVPKRRQTQRAGIRYRKRDLVKSDVAIVEGLPAMSLERTLADLLDDVGDMSLVADALSAAVAKRTMDFARLRDLLAPLADRNGFKRHDGNAVLNRLLEIAGLDRDSVARRIPADSALGSKILENYLKTAGASIVMPDMSELSRRIAQLIPADLVQKSIPADFGQKIAETLKPHLAVYEKTWGPLLEDISRNTAKTYTPSIDPSFLERLSNQWENKPGPHQVNPSSDDEIRALRKDDE